MHLRYRLTLELILETIQDGCNSTPCLALLTLVGLSEAGCGCVSDLCMGQGCAGYVGEHSWQAALLARRSHDAQQRAESKPAILQMFRECCMGDTAS